MPGSAPHPAADNPTHAMSTLILVTGANGYIASRLIPRLLELGYPVRALAREPERLRGRAWLPRVEVLRGDTAGEADLARALQGVHTAYYLIHSMASGRGYTRLERESARRFASAAEAAGVQHIIYLGGLADPGDLHLAAHMRSRIETGEILRQGRLPVTEFRAGVIVGAGSISFEMIRFLTEAFPILPGPAWLRNQAQPMAAANVIDYLVAPLERLDARGGIYEMGGPDRMQYAQAMLGYARVRGLKRWLFTVPGIPVPFMARFVDWLSPVPYWIAVALVGGLRSDSIVTDPSAQGAFPEVRLIPYDQAVSAALADLTPGRLERVWEGLGRVAVDIKHEGFMIDYRRLPVHASAAGVFKVISGLGGERGWLYANWLWRLRGWLDQVIQGKRRERSAKPTSLAIGSRVDYYRVEALEPDHMLRLHSELKAPGEGWLEWRVKEESFESSTVEQTAFFAPRGFPGFAYWLILLPLHRLVFRGLIHAIRDRSEAA
jgi:uncharacterized protein YbjT (DUF2867 family)